eukprot:scaffold115468_cov36-Tisochrysis_lutea.AAC.1
MCAVLGSQSSGAASRKPSMGCRQTTQEASFPCPRARVTSTSVHASQAATWPHGMVRVSRFASRQMEQASSSCCDSVEGIDASALRGTLSYESALRLSCSIYLNVGQPATTAAIVTSGSITEPSRNAFRLLSSCFVGGAGTDLKKGNEPYLQKGHPR